MLHKTKTSFITILKTTSNKKLSLKRHDKPKRLNRALTSSSSQIWKSRLSWRIAAAVFMTILLVQTMIMNFGTVPTFRQRLLDDLKETNSTAIAAMIDPSAGYNEAPFTSEQAARFMAISNVKGMSIYSYQNEPIAAYGAAPSIKKEHMTVRGHSKYTPDIGLYEIVLNAADLKRPYYIAVKIDADSVQEQIAYFITDTIKIMLIMSLFVTTVLMIALGHWLLEPMLFMRSNLLAAFKAPEEPDIPKSPFDNRDEIGSAIELTQKLIHQNAENLTRIKSAAEDKIHKLAYYDTLTGLPNRTLFVQTLNEQARQKQDGSAERFAVVTIDLDHFKDINDSMGHNIGDAILRSVARRLRSAMPESAVVSKSGEDEYVIMMPLSTEISSSRAVAEKVWHVIRSEPFKVFNESFQVRASIGVATFPDDAIDPDQVLKNADIALNRAKEEGRDTIKEYSEDFDRAVQARFQMLRNLRDAMEHNQLELYYQPQIDLHSGEIIGAEALLRWFKPNNSKEGGTFISPADFIPVAEQSGLIVPIGEWVMLTACKTAKNWKDEHGIDIRIAINVSAHQFSQSDICAFTQKTISEVGIDAHKVELEVTESVFMDDISHTIQTLQNLHAIGVELAIDDFGTGYSSLSYLRQFPIDRLKIDQSFIRNALNDQDDASIARTIIALGHALNLKVIAEGVETIDHEAFLIKEGCDEVQGFRYSRPVPAKDFLHFAKNYKNDLKPVD
ncbi:MAG: EAL domain-containing protein [Rhodospirillales bacterium]|nr:EAL domain-containing protein [Alphaproteobacteria bacterium]MCB9981927.1 EAL domain-containing protein [Rhodospirillales bacterium]